MGAPTTASLDQILRNPCVADSLPREVWEQLLREAAAVQCTLVAHPPSAASGENSGRASTSEADDKMLTVEEAAIRLRQSRRWLYRHASHLPFVRRLSPRSLLVSEAGLARWLDRRKP